MRILKKIILLSCVIGFFVNAKAQNYDVYNDAGMWNTLNLSYRINKKYTALFTQELRLNENFGRLNLLYNNIGMQYTVNKQIKTSLVYRNIQKNIETNTISFRHRLMWDVVAKQVIKKMYVTYRHRLQAEMRDVRSSELGKIPEVYSRSKFEVGYNLNKKTSLWTGFEVRYQFTDAREPLDNFGWRRVRWMMGADYDLNKTIKLGAYFVYQREFKTITPNFLYITGLECNMNVNKVIEKFKKKSKAIKK